MERNQPSLHDFAPWFTLREYSQIEVIVIVGDENVSLTVLHHADGIVGNSFGADGSQELSIVGENLDTMSTIVGYEDFLLIIAANAVGEFQVFRACKLV
jgi:hypothetical protein